MSRSKQTYIGSGTVYINPKDTRAVVLPNDPSQTIELLRNVLHALERGQYELLAQPKLEWVELNMEQEVQINISLTMGPK